MNYKIKDERIKAIYFFNFFNISQYRWYTDKLVDWNPIAIAGSRV